MDVVIKESPIEGKGVFAVRDFMKGETVLKWTVARLLTEAEARAVPAQEKRYLSPTEGGRFILQQEPERFVNHSCDPNTFVRDRQDIALRPIKKGEEITSDYALEGGDWEFRCACGSPKCRKTITGNFSTLGTRAKKRLEPCLQGWFKAELLGGGLSGLSRTCAS